MTSHLSDALRRHPILSRPRRRRVMKTRTRPARAPYMLTLSARRIVRRNLPEAVVPYLRMSGRWLEEHGFAIGSGVQVLVEQGRVTLISEAWKLRVAGCELPGQLRLDEEALATRNPQLATQR